MSYLVRIHPEHGSIRYDVLLYCCTAMVQRALWSGPPSANLQLTGSGIENGKSGISRQLSRLGYDDIVCRQVMRETRSQYPELTSLCSMYVLTWYQVQGGLRRDGLTPACGSAHARNDEASENVDRLSRKSLRHAPEQCIP